jgi:hypothetical protein
MKYIIESTTDLFVGQNEDSVLWETWGTAGNGKDLEASLTLLHELREEHRNSLNPGKLKRRFRLIQISIEEV